ncbi:hypothetical protein OKA04_18900 [Luteolibacter flavescens]|uniref:Uncharacterized protein n=1 Tax=Luteolibacter flavescens TaxID=1859460 RepID=A0ABT3FTB0_9BACT|nr:hypothetical protein [Luteolibacter flavescens]MCW1886816.1 hypothetical protein [Luteolibacter flavescens]
MKAALVSTLLLSLLLPVSAQVKRVERKSLIDRDPDVVHLTSLAKDPVELKVIKEATVFSDKNGKSKLGILRSDQTVILEAMTEKAYKVRGQGEKNGISGWVGPHAFSSKDPNFVENLKKLHARQVEVQALIEEKELAIGMTPEEVTQSRGKPTKTSVKRTEKGQTGKWEYIDFEQVQHFTYSRDPYTGQTYRQLSHVTQEEKEKTVVEFENGVVSSLEESEQRRRAPVKIVVPPLVFAW